MIESTKDIGVNLVGDIHMETKVRHLPAGPALTAIMLYDLFLFGAIFVSYTLDRNKDVDLFNSSQEVVNANVGAINTIILLTSSWFVVAAIEMAKEEKWRISSRLFSGAICCGVLFMMVKAFEYAVKVSAGLSMVTNDFFMYYFVLTGFHGLHVLIGILFLAFCRWKARTAVSSGENVLFFEKCGTYWHVVDVIWIMLFALLYLVR